VTLTLLPLRGGTRQPALPFEPEQLRVLLCDGDSALLPCSDVGASSALRPDPDVLGALVVLEQRFVMTLVSTTGAAEVGSRLAGCGMEECFPPAARFTDAAALDPAPYLDALAGQHCFGPEGLAVVAGPESVRTARAAGVWVVGNLQYVDPEVRPERCAALLEAGAHAVVTSWEHLLVTLLG
jgi:beta-phosphoglucomutase-like phosphatase (HAD superfamily)